ncbi:hypothetical protein CPELA_04750 [Corynebacterium pelargi]|uniref:DUF4192 domain-containing protein n=2 Tax=Corynebacterium pelargi TaxID=1471400 RepID=A0A410W8F0_9CORY|nr:hypothetical protein CPELA_04750 [Corynebacterium pelargi]
MLCINTIRRAASDPGRLPGMTENNTPGTLLANIPGILGYYPQESLVVVTLGPLSGGRRHVGPVLRLDLCDLRYAYDLGDALTNVDIDLAFAFVVSETFDAEQLNDLQSLLQSLSGCGLLPIQHCWHVEEITGGATYKHLPIEADTTVPSGWQRGSIPDISASTSLHAMLTLGELPMLNRQEAKDYFCQRPKWAHRSWREKAAQQALVHGAQMIRSFLEGVASIDIAIDRLCINLAAVPASSQLRAKHVKPLAQWMSSVSLRDASVEAFMRDRALGRRAALAVASCYDGEIRANALCMYAVCALGTAASFRVPFALECAGDTSPGHRLTHLLQLGYRRGDGEVVIGAVVRGSHRTLATMRGDEVAA